MTASSSRVARLHRADAAIAPHCVAKRRASE